MTDYYAYIERSDENNETLLCATEKSYFDEHRKPDDADTDAYVTFYETIAAEGFSEIFPPLYRTRKPVSIAELKGTLWLKDINLIASPEFDAAAKILIQEGP